MPRKSRAPQFLMALPLVLLFKAQVSMGQSMTRQSIMRQSITRLSITSQSISQQKKAVVFIFGTIHPLNPDRTAMTDMNGKRVAANVPLGTGFFVDYPDLRLGANQKFSYLVTAKHVLQDVDGTLLPSISIRLNLKSPVGDSDLGFIEDIPVTDAHGNLLWFQSEDRVEDVAVLPLFPDEDEFDFTTISAKTFLNDRALNSGVVAEGDDLYFIGLMEQYYGTKRNYPLLRRGTLALLTDESIETPSGRQTFFLAELESWPGNSGSPVFLPAGRRDRSPAAGSPLSFLGMIVGSFLNRYAVPLNGVPSARQLQAGDKANIGVTCIVPAPLIEKVLASPPAQRDRDARMRKSDGVFR
jgi:hypothetical protein